MKSRRRKPGTQLKRRTPDAGCNFLQPVKITPHDNGTVLVESESRPGESHIVDLQEMNCSCEAFANREKLGRALCKHIDLVLSVGGRRLRYRTE